MTDAGPARVFHLSSLATKILELQADRKDTPQRASNLLKTEATNALFRVPAINHLIPDAQSQNRQFIVM